MQAIQTLKAAIPALVAAVLIAPAAQAGDKSPHKLGDHPAVVVQRLQKNAGYDYASKFYAHPAGLRLYMQQPAADDSDMAATDAVREARLSDAAARRLGTDSLPR
jgi:hypothetical protein